MMHTSNAVLDRAFLTIRTLVAITSVINYGTKNYVVYARINTLRAINIDYFHLYVDQKAVLSIVLTTQHHPINKIQSSP